MPFRIVFAFSLLTASMLRAQDSGVTEDRRVAVLIGRPQIEIYAAGPDPDDALRDSGVTLARVKDDTELILRRSGIPVVEQCSWYESNCGRLIVSVETVKLSPMYAFDVRAEYREWVSSLRPGCPPS